MEAHEVEWFSQQFKMGVDYAHWWTEQQKRQRISNMMFDRMFVSTYPLSSLVFQQLSEHAAMTKEWLIQQQLESLNQLMLFTKRSVLSTYEEDEKTIQEKPAPITAKRVRTTVKKSLLKKTNCCSQATLKTWLDEILVLRTALCVMAFLLTKITIEKFIYQLFLEKYARVCEIITDDTASKDVKDNSELEHCLMWIMNKCLLVALQALRYHYLPSCKERIAKDFNCLKQDITARSTKKPSYFFQRFLTLVASGFCETYKYQTLNTSFCYELLKTKFDQDDMDKKVPTEFTQLFTELRTRHMQQKTTTATVSCRSKKPRLH